LARLPIVCCLFLLAGCHPSASVATYALPARDTPAAERHILRLPPRPADALTGSAFIDRAVSMRPGEREHAIVAEILSGNVPEFERKLLPVDLQAKDREGNQLRGRIFVLPDYLAIGSDDDFVRFPMTVRNARKIARETGTVLPTPHIVDVIHAAAAARIASPYKTPGDAMASAEYFRDHNRTIEERRKKHGHVLGTLLSGPKKDLVISIRMLETPRRTPIYGWFNDDGTVIQTLSLLHDDHYVDYAHGIRLVDAEMEVAGKPAHLLDVLATRAKAPLISNEGFYDLRFVWEKGW